MYDICMILIVYFMCMMNAYLYIHINIINFSNRYMYICTFLITKGCEPSLVGITKNEVQERKDIGKRFENKFLTSLARG